MKHAATLVFAVMFGLTAWLVVRERGKLDDRQAAKDEQLGDSVRQLRRELQSLGRTVGGLAEVVALQQQTASSGPGRGQDREVVEPDRGRDTPSPAGEPPTREEVFRQLEERTKTEARDPSWAPEAELQVRSQLEQSFGGGNIRLESIVCASSACMIEISHPESARFPDSVLKEFFKNRSGLANMQGKLQTVDGVTTMFMLRENAPPDSAD